MFRLILLATLLLAVPRAWASAPALPPAERVRSIAPQDAFYGNARIHPGSNPAPLLSMGHTLFLFAGDATHGAELWKTDGTEEGTALVKDIYPGPNGSVWTFPPLMPGESPIAELKGTFFFFADDGVHGQELWKSDGTEEGTRLVRDIHPGPGGSTGYTSGGWQRVLFFEVGEAVFFLADDGAHGLELWKTDGTEPGTTLVADLRVGPEGSELWWARAVNGTLYFAADDGVHGREPWKTDGTPAGTTLIKDILPGAYANSPYSSNPDNPVVLNGTLYFTASDGVHTQAVWKTDGTTAGTTLVLDPASDLQGGYPQGMYNVGGALLLTASNGLWRSDGTTASVVFSGRQLTPYDPRNVGGTLFFIVDSAERAPNGAPAYSELWKTDGTSAGTGLVKSFSGTASLLSSAGGTLYFVTNDGEHGDELWKTDGTSAGTTRVDNTGTDPKGVPSSNFFSLSEPLGGRLYFAGDDGEHGWELWSTDGTSAGTLLVKDIATEEDGARPSDLKAMGGKLYFTANGREQGYELWTSDGTERGTHLVKDIRSGPEGSLSGFWLTETRGTLLFSADDGIHGTELWKSNGTEQGTVLVEDIYPGRLGSMGYVSPSMSTGETTFFVARQEEASPGALWKTDGTEQGTVLVKDFRTLWPTFGRPPVLPSMATVNGTLYFFANDGAHGYELWKSDGTEAGTVLVKDLRPGPEGMYGDELTNVKGTLFFHPYDDPSEAELWKSDGTEEGTVILVRLPTRFLTSVGDTLYFAAGDDAHGWELWKSDGTEEGTVLVKDIHPGPGSSAPTRLVDVNGTLYFVADDGEHGAELWKSDGTEAGTVLVSDLRPDAQGSGPDSLTAVDGKLYFAADDGVRGWELWMTDGTAEGTLARTDISPGPGSSALRYPTRVGNHLFFTARDEHGYALWRLPLEETSGCGCTSLPSASVGAGWGLLLLLVWSARRRHTSS